MTLILNEDEQMLADGAKDWADNEHPLSQFRAMRDAGKTWNPGLWRSLIELGYPAMGASLANDGLDLGGQVALIEPLGANLVATPLISAWVSALIDPQGTDLVSGKFSAFAWMEAGARGDRTASALVENGTITGAKQAVWDVDSAKAIVVSALYNGHLGLFRVAKADCTITALHRIDHRDTANVAFDGAPCTRLAGDEALLNTALDRATVALCAEMLGGMTSAMKMLVTYLCERRQFESAIGSFQAVQHRTVDCFIEIELARSPVLGAARDPTPANVSLAKARCSDAYVLLANEAVQFHGGIGVTDEHDIGFHLKRARVCSLTLGSSDWHRRRWAVGHGY